MNVQRYVKVAGVLLLISVVAGGFGEAYARQSSSWRAMLLQLLRTSKIPSSFTGWGSRPSWLSRLPTSHLR